MVPQGLITCEEKNGGGDKTCMMRTWEYNCDMIIIALANSSCPPTSIFLNINSVTCGMTLNTKGQVPLELEFDNRHESHHSVLHSEEPVGCRQSNKAANSVYV